MLLWLSNHLHHLRFAGQDSTAAAMASCLCFLPLAFVHDTKVCKGLIASSGLARCSYPDCKDGRIAFHCKGLDCEQTSLRIG